MWFAYIGLMVDGVRAAEKLTTMNHPLRRSMFAIVVLAIGTAGGSACNLPQAESGVIGQTTPIPAKALLTTREIQPIPELPGVVSSEPHEPNPQALRHLRTGQERFDEGLWADATAALEKALQVDPQLVEARILLARAAIQHGNHALALSHLDEASRLSPRHPAVHQLLGELAIQQRKKTQAISSLRLALAASEDTPRLPERVLAHLSLALVLKEEGYLTAAAEQLTAYLDALREPTADMEKHRELREMRILYRGRASAMLGDIQLELQKPNEAVEAFRIAVEESPDDRALATQLILALAQSGRHDEAMDRACKMINDADTSADSGFALLEEVCKLSGRPEAFDEQMMRMAREQENPALRLRIAELLLKRGNTRSAAAVLTVLTEGDAEDQQALLLLARLRIELEQFVDAATLLYRVLATAPGAYPGVEDLIRGAYRENRGAGLTEAVRQQRSANWDNPTGLLLLALCEMSAGQVDEAAQLCRDALKKDAAFDTATVLLARISLRKRDYLSAIESAESAIDGGTEVGELHQIRGRAYDALGEHEKAEAAFLDAFRLNRKNPEPLYRLAESVERRGDALRCEQLYRRILDDVDPHYIPARERLVRLLLNSRKNDRAKEYFADFERLGQSGPAVERCRALLKLATSKAPTGRERLEDYRDDLRRIVSELPDEAATHLALAMSHEAVGEYTEALKEVEIALAIDPDDVDCLKRKAEYQSKRLDFRSAVATVRQLLEYHPNDREIHNHLVRYSWAHGDLETAADELRWLLGREQLAEHKTIYVNQLYLVLRFSKKFDEAVEAVKSWLDESPDDPRRRDLYLTALRDADRTEEAIQQASQWLAEDSEDMARRATYISQLVSAKRNIEAQQIVLTWLADDPDNFELNRLLILLLWEEQNWDSAIETILTGMEDPRLRENYRDYLGRSYRYARRWDDAVEMYRRRGDSDRSGFANFELIGALIEARRFDEAEKEISGFLNPKSPAQEGLERFNYMVVLQARRYMARIYQLSDREMQAIQQLEEIYALLEGISQMDPGSNPVKSDFVGIHNDLGYTLADEGIRLDDAERMIRFALSEDPLNAAYIDSLGWVFYKQGRFDEAIEYLNRSVLLTLSEDAVMYDHLADAYYRAGQVDKARENWLKALEKSQTDRFPPQLIEDEHLHEQVQRKLRQLDDGEPVETAPLARPVVPALKDDNAGKHAAQPTTRPDEKTNAVSKPSKSTSEP